MSITIISGGPGSGKTTVSRALARSQPDGVHIESDYFLRCIAHRVDPTMPRTRHQNRTVMRACATTARIYSENGYSVYLDAVIGPWRLSLFREIIPAFDYVLLHAPLSTIVERVRSRKGHVMRTPGVAARLHRRFAGVIDEHERHVVRTDNASLEEICSEIRSRGQKRALAIGNA